jgi:glycosyltransferase involved in cell wall biosynthesis
MSIINVCTPGHADMADSYGLIACQLARHLAAMGHYVNLFAFGNAQHPSQPADVAAVTSQPVRAAFGGVYLGYPATYSLHPPMTQSRPRVALTMFESTIIPMGWAEILNTMDAVIVPSTFCHEVFQSCGVTVPLHIAPLGINEVYQPAPRTTDRPFTFLAFLDRGLRKGGLTALQAFVRAFGDDPDYRLILKARKAREGRALDGITNPNITVVQRDMSEQELYQLYLSAHCLVNPNKGEGFGLLPREFASSGGLALATDWGGTADDIERWGVPIPYRLINADWRGVKKWEGQELGQWAEVDTDELANLMRYVARERDCFMHRAMVEAPGVRRMYDWRRFAGQVLEVWNGVNRRNTVAG